MHKIKKIIAASILICAITFTSYAEELNVLQEQKTNVQTELEEKSQELDNINEELTQNLMQIQKLDENIEETEKKLQQTNTEIEQTEKQVKGIEQNLDNINAKYIIQKQLLDERLITMYEGGNTSYLDVLVGAKNISDFISMYFLLSELMTNDIDLLEQVATVKKQIEEENLEISNIKKQLEIKRVTEQKTQITLSNTKLLRENYLSKLSQEEQELQSQIDEYNNQIKAIELEIRALSQSISFGEEYKGGQMQWPIFGYYNITSNYGMRVHPITGVYKLHTGVDIGAPMGTDFTAMADGIVAKAEYNNAYGNMVVIDHGGGVQTLYAHGSEIIANIGQEVKAGDVVLKVGSTGYSTGPHAHFEVRVNGETVNPLDYVTKQE